MPSNENAIDALFQAIKEKNADVVLDLVSKHNCVNSVGIDEGAEITPLLLATWLCDEEIVDLLLKNGADVNAKAEFGVGNDEVIGVSPLMVAAMKWGIKGVKQLIAAGADVNARNTAGKTALMLTYGNFSGFDGCLCHDVDECYEIIKALLTAGADTNAKDKDGNSVLTHAVENVGIFPDYSFIFQLVDAGASLNVPPTLYDDLAAELLYHADIKKFKYVLDLGATGENRYNGLPLLIEAIEEKKTEHIKLLLAAGANANAVKHTMNSHKTALMIGCEQGDINLVNLLLKAGADVNAQDEDGWTALMTACRQGENKIVKLLLKAGARIDVRSQWGKTALQIAKGWRKATCEKLILEADPHSTHTIIQTFKKIKHKGGKALDYLREITKTDGRDIEGKTVLIEAARAGLVECVQELLSRGFDANLLDIHNHSALMAAAETGKLACIRALIAGGADVNLCTIDKENALILAMKSGHDACVRELINNGARLKMTGKLRAWQQSTNTNASPEKVHD